MGKPISSSITSGLSCSAAINACSPSYTTRVLCSCISSNICMLSALSWLSSTINTFRAARGVSFVGFLLTIFGLAVTGLQGKYTINSLPCPKPSLRHSTCPPCISTKRFTSDSPMPKPPSDCSRC